MKNSLKNKKKDEHEVGNKDGDNSERGKGREGETRLTMTTSVNKK